MKATFVGHQTWLLETAAGCIYFDPILTETFGHSNAVQFPVFPPRRVDFGSLPSPAAVVISHEHHDHFHLPSLHLLRRLGCSRAFVGELVPAIVSEFLEKLGFDVSLVRTGEPVYLGDVALHAFQCDPHTARWEERSYQWLIRDGEDALFNAVDAHLSSAALRHPVVQQASTLIVANNSQVPPNPKYNNLLHDAVETTEQRLLRRAQLFRALVHYPTKTLTNARQLLICGSGYLEPAQEFGAFVDSDNQALSQAFAELRPDLVIRGAIPGFSYHINDHGVSSAGYIELDSAGEHELRARGERASKSGGPLKPLPKLSASRQCGVNELAESRVIQELAELRGLLMMSGFGKVLVHSGHSRPFVLRFNRTSGNPLLFAFDIRAGHFVADDATSSDLLLRYPYGIEMSLEDFVAMLDAQVQVWDLVNVASRSWSKSEQADTPNTFLFSAYGEHCRPDLTRKLLERTFLRLSGEQ